MGIIWSTIKVGEGSSKEVATVVIGEVQVYSNKAPSTSTSTIAIGEDQVCSMYEVSDGKTTSMPVTVANLLPFDRGKLCFKPAPSDKEAREAISTIKERTEIKGSEVEKYRNLKSILDKSKEMVLEVVIKSFDGMEKVFLPREQPHQNTKQSSDFKYAEESTCTSQKIFNITRTPFLATLLIDTVVFAYRIIRLTLK